MSTLLVNGTEADERRWLEAWTKGPSRLRWTELPPQVGDAAPDAALVDATGEPRRLAESWRDGSALVLFWRHFGCGCGVDRAGRLKAEYDDYVAAGANVVVVGQGEPERAAAYAERFEIPCPVLVDRDESAYRAYGLVEGQSSQVLFDAPPELLAHTQEQGLDFIAARREMGRPLVDNPWLLPGEFVVGRDGVIRLAYRYQYCEDFPNPLVLATALRDS